MNPPAPVAPSLAPDLQLELARKFFAKYNQIKRCESNAAKIYQYLSALPNPHMDESDLQDAFDALASAGELILLDKTGAEISGRALRRLPAADFEKLLQPQPPLTAEIKELRMSADEFRHMHAEDFEHAMPDMIKYDREKIAATVRGLPEFQQLVFSHDDVIFLAEELERAGAPVSVQSLSAAIRENRRRFAVDEDAEKDIHGQVVSLRAAI
jgi:hypothetical protein